MICPKCGSFVHDFSRYCTRCGTDVLRAPAYDASKGKRSVKHMELPHAHSTSRAAWATTGPRGMGPNTQHKRNQTRIVLLLFFLLPILAIALPILGASLPTALYNQNDDDYNDRGYEYSTADDYEYDYGTANDYEYDYESDSGTGSDNAYPAFDGSLYDVIYTQEDYKIYYQSDDWTWEGTDERWGVFGNTFTSSGASTLHFIKGGGHLGFDMNTESGRSQALLELLAEHSISGHHEYEVETIARLGTLPASYGNFVSIDEIAPYRGADWPTVYLASGEFFDNDIGREEKVMRVFFVASEDGRVLVWYSESDPDKPDEYLLTEQFFGGLYFK
ncbi:MAG: zinc ribbon domain-containing protein [Clostridiales Family XIII bacterium]|jgi:hypothetical protein|nr:zinc ribbon domain-containing protein [Clostridiales Family XIII bacterium]